MAENHVTLVGNATRDGDLSFSAQGTAITSFGLAINSRKQVNGEWVDGDPQFYEVKSFGEFAENVAETIMKGTRVVVTGRLNYQSWEKDGERRNKIEVIADAIGPDLKWATAVVTRTQKS